MLNKVFAHLQQFWQNPETLRFIQPDGSVLFKPVQPKHIKRLQVFFKMMGSRGFLQNQQELSNMLFFIKILQNLPQVGRVINFVELAKTIYDKIGLKNQKSIFVEPTPPAPTSTTNLVPPTTNNPS